MSKSLFVAQRGEAGDLAVERGDEGERAGELLRESRFVIGRGGPGGALILVVIVRGERLDARAKQLARAAAHRPAERDEAREAEAARAHG